MGIDEFHVDFLCCLLVLLKWSNLSKCFRNLPQSLTSATNTAASNSLNSRNAQQLQQQEQQHQEEQQQQQMTHGYSQSECQK